MMFGMAAATSALDLIKTLTQPSAPKATGTVVFPTAGTPLSDGTTTGSSSSSQPGLIAPTTMNALFAAQSQSGVSSSTVSRSDALKDLFAKIDGDGDGKITKSEFENALGAGGTNTANADSVFGELDADGDGSVSLGELAAALKPKHHAHRPKQGGEDVLLQALDGANSSSTTNSDGSTTTSLTYANGSTVTMTQPAASSQSSSATLSYNAIERMIQQQAAMLARTAASSLSVSV